MEDRLHLKVQESSKKIIQANGPEKQPGVDILVSDIIAKLIRGDRKGYYILIQGKLHQEDITIPNILCDKHRGTQVH